MGYLEGASGGGATIKDIVGGFGGGGGGGGVHKYSQGGGGGGYSGGRSGANAMNSCGGGGRSFNARKNQRNERCCKTSTHGQVTITFLLDFWTNYRHDPIVLLCHKLDQPEQFLNYVTYVIYSVSG